ncbi:MAG: hypothetical protein ACRETY_06000 [Steroidobacteraceae bacterium]
MDRHSFSRRMIRATLAALLALASTPALALERGEFRDGLYVAPGALFTVRSPLGPSPIVIDSFDRSAGAVTFVDQAGALYGVICTPSFDVLAGADNDPETDHAILRNWFRDATFPLFFERQLPGSTVIHEEPGSFEGRPAWIAVVHLPRGSARFRSDPKTSVATREDSFRGLVVFSRGNHTFMIMTETAPELDWDAFLPLLSDFYHGMAFLPPPILPAGERIAEVRVPGT